MITMVCYVFLGFDDVFFVEVVCDCGEHIMPPNPVKDGDIVECSKCPAKYRVKIEVADEKKRLFNPRVEVTRW